MKTNDKSNIEETLKYRAIDGMCLKTYLTEPVGAKGSKGTFSPSPG
jgi:hypothetical protein